MTTQRRHQLKLLATAPAWWACAAWPGPAAAQTSAGGLQPAALVLTRLHASVLTGLSTADAARWLQQQLPDGQWPDIDYRDSAVGNWLPIGHLLRVRAMAAAFKAAGNPLAGRVDVLSAVASGLRAWLRLRPTSGNWWHNTIGQQLVLAPVLLLLHADLPPDLLRDAAMLLQDPGSVPHENNTGQNRVWYGQQQLMRGALLARPADLEGGSAALLSTLKITNEEGIQPDFSFHQHGAQLYSGGYGLGFLVDLARAAGWVAGTPWAFTAAHLELLADYALLGLAPLVRGNWLDWGARGREFTRDERDAKPRRVMLALQLLSDLVPDRHAALKTTAAAIDASAPPWLGNKLFWRSDFMVHQVRAGYLSVKMMSSRTVGTESGNGENLLGYWLPFGITYIIRRGDEYDGLPPVWDWSALPGLTAPAETPPLAGYQRHTSHFVGGVSDGGSGVAAMHLDKLRTKARKAWFFHGELLVVLGAGIESQSAQPVRTTLNQTRWRGAVVTDQGPVDATRTATALPGHRWLWMDGVTYLLLDAAGATVQLARRSQGKNLINPALGRADVEAQVMTLAVNHGTRPTDAHVAYGVWLGAATAAEAGKAPTVQVLANNPQLQAIRHADGLVQIVFHAAGSVALNEKDTLRASAQCIVQARMLRDQWQFSVTDPTRQRPDLRLEVQTNGQTRALSTLQLPASAAVAGQITWRAPGV